MIPRGASNFYKPPTDGVERFLFRLSLIWEEKLHALEGYADSKVSEAGIELRIPLQKLPEHDGSVDVLGF